MVVLLPVLGKKGCVMMKGRGVRRGGGELALRFL